MSNFKPKKVTESNTKIREAKDLEPGDWVVFEGDTESRCRVDKRVETYKGTVEGTGITKITLEHTSGVIEDFYYSESDKITIIPRRTHSWGVGGTNLYFNF